MRNPFRPPPLLHPWTPEELAMHDAIEAVDVPVGFVCEVIAGHLAGAVCERVRDPRQRRDAPDGRPWWPRFRTFIGSPRRVPGSIAPYTPVRVL